MKEKMKSKNKGMMKNKRILKMKNDSFGKGMKIE